MKKKIYVEFIIHATNEETKEFYSNLFKVENKIRENFSEDEREEKIYLYHEYIRKLLNLENKLFVMGEATNAETGEREVILFFFDREPDGKCYKVHDEDVESGNPFGFYIEVDE